jgi:hypothetical protein
MSDHYDIIWLIDVLPPRVAGEKHLTYMHAHGGEVYMYVRATPFHSNTGLFGRRRRIVDLSRTKQL